MTLQLNMELIKGEIMRTTDEVYIKLNELYWEVLAANEEISRFKDEFFTIAMDEGFEREDIEEFWGIG